MPGVMGGMHGWCVLMTRFRREKALKALKKVQVLKQSYVLKSCFRREKALKALIKVQVLKQSYVLKSRFRREKALKALKTSLVLL